MDFNAARQIVHKKWPLIVIGIIGLALYVALNVGVYHVVVKKPRGSSTMVIPTDALPTAEVKRAPTASPTPIKGPGPYACDPLGVCNRYADSVRKANCTVTYADPNCQFACEVAANRCKQ